MTIEQNQPAPPAPAGAVATGAVTPGSTGNGAGTAQA